LKNRADLPVELAGDNVFLGAHTDTILREEGDCRPRYGPRQAQRAGIDFPAITRALLERLGLCNASC
jgi:hypothetical protein